MPNHITTEITGEGHSIAPVTQKMLDADAAIFRHYGFEPDWTTLEGRGTRLAVQLAPDHVPPQWPDPAHPQQLHLDVHVDDPDEAERQVLALGARRLPDPVGAEDFRVFADPAGHPFCLVFST